MKLAGYHLKKHSLISPGIAILTGLGLCALLAPFIYAYGFIFPQGDDFDEATRAVCLFDFIGGIYEVIREWFSWSGRYTYHFLAVFFGKAAESRFWSGAVCFAVLCSYAFALAWLITPVIKHRFYSSIHASVFSVGALVALYAAYGTLPNFYLLTDALTSAHQGATALLFLALVITLWQKTDSQSGDCKKEWRRTLLTGIFAIGVYEHAALAVICISLTAVFLAILLKRLNRVPLLDKIHLPHQPQKTARWERFLGKMLGKFNTPAIRPFITLFACLLLPLAFSFLAPGNLARNAKRGVSLDLQLEQIRMVFQDWLWGMGVFFESPWIPLLVCLVVAMRFFVRPAKSKNWRFSLFTAFASCVCFLVFSFSLVFLHALTDTPFPSQPKLVASFCFYAAITFSVLLFHGLSCFTFPETWPHLARSLLSLACMAIFACLVLNTPNYRKTFINAANGNMLVLAEDMETRNIWLKELREENAIQPDPAGLLGEILFPGARERKARPDLSHAIVKRLGQSVFPVYIQETLAMNCESWPNLWASWMYGHGCVTANPPETGIALELVKSGDAVELDVPPALREQGLNAAWRVNARGGAGPTFALTWLVLKKNWRNTGSLEVLRPNPLSELRLLPSRLQEEWLESMNRAKSFVPEFREKCAGAILSFSPGSGFDDGALVALPIGQTQLFSTAFPQIIFISVNNSSFYPLAQKGKEEQF